MNEDATPYTIVAVLDDLIFATKIQSTARAVGATVHIVKSAADVAPLLRAGAPHLLILDLNHLGNQAGPLIALIKGAASSPRVVAYVSHVDQDLANAAKDAGADEVLPRSRFVQVLPELLSAPPR